MQHNKKILLVLSVGLSSCFHFVKVLKEKFYNDFYIIGADINEEYLVSSAKYTDKFYKVPYSTDSTYYQIILDICKTEKVDYILANLDIDRSYFYPENTDLINLGVKSLSTPLRLAKEYSKKDINAQLVKYGFPTPNLYNVDELEDGVKYIVKPIKGVGSVGVEKLTGEKIRQKDNLDNFIIQELCSEPEVTLECFNYDGKITTVARQRIESKSGICTKAKVYFDSELDSVARKYIEIFNPGTYFNIQFMKNSGDEYVITDLNYRLAGGTGLSYSAGWDEVSALANIMLGKSTNEVFSSFNLSAPVQYIIRTYQDIVSKKMSVIAFDLDGTILNSFQRHIDVMKLALAKYNLDLDLSDYIEFKRDGYNNVKYLKTKGLNDDLINKIQKFWMENIENEEFLSLDVLYPDAEAKLSALKKDSELILITARNNKNSCKQQVASLGLNKLFSKIFIVDSNATTSDLKANILIENYVSEMYGDTESDKKACDIANIKFNAVYHGFRNEKMLNQNPPPRQNNIISLKINNNQYMEVIRYAKVS